MEHVSPSAEVVRKSWQHRVTREGQSWLVRSTSGKTYRVTLDDVRLEPTCSCTHGSHAPERKRVEVCSHLLAAAHAAKHARPFSCSCDSCQARYLAEEEASRA